MAVKLHRCSVTFVKGRHPCWQVEKALQEAGVPYEVVKHPAIGRNRRKELIALSGQNMLPVIELEDGTAVRDESKKLVERIKAGELSAA